MMLPQNHSDKAIWFVIFIAFLLLVGNFIFTQYEIFQIKNSVIQQRYDNISSVPSTPAFVIQTPMPTPTITPTKMSSVPTATPKIVYIAPTPQANLVTYIPLSGGNTQNTDWTGVLGSQFTFNISDYGTKSYAVWDANLHVDNANGTTFARIFDTTHGIAVNGSEINISNTSTSTDVTSGALSFWAGNNSYVVQIKSLNSSTAFVDSGKIKITY